MRYPKNYPSRLKDNYRNNRTWCEICSKLTSPERLQWRRAGVFIVNFEHISVCSSVSIVNFEHVIDGWDVRHFKIYTSIKHDVP